MIKFRYAVSSISYQCHVYELRNIAIELTEILRVAIFKWELPASRVGTKEHRFSHLPLSFKKLIYRLAFHSLSTIMTDPSASTSTANRAKYLKSSVDHPRLQNTDAASIRKFLRAYDQYSKEVEQRAKKLSATMTISKETVTLVSVKFWYNVEWIESLIALGFIVVTNYDELDDKTLRTYIDRESEESKDVLNMNVLDDIINKHLRTNMEDSNAKYRMRNHFVSYHTILHCKEIGWIMKDNQKVEVNHVLSAFSPMSLRQRLESDISFAHHNLKKVFPHLWSMPSNSWKPFSSSIMASRAL